MTVCSCFDLVLNVCSSVFILHLLCASRPGGRPPAALPAAEALHPEGRPGAALSSGQTPTDPLAARRAGHRTEPQR